jgi:hypothetical protein
MKRYATTMLAALLPCAAVSQVHPHRATTKFRSRAGDGRSAAFAAGRHRDSATVTFARHATVALLGQEMHARRHQGSVVPPPPARATPAAAVAWKVYTTNPITEKRVNEPTDRAAATARKPTQGHTKQPTVQPDKTATDALVEYIATLDLGDGKAGGASSEGDPTVPDAAAAAPTAKEVADQVTAFISHLTAWRGDVKKLCSDHGWLAVDIAAIPAADLVESKQVVNCTGDGESNPIGDTPMRSRSR